MLTIVVTVWGEWHRRVFAHKALPTILHESNLPAMGLDCKFVIYTKEGGYNGLREQMEVIQRFVPCEIVEANLPDGYKTAWQDANLKNDGLILQIQPDIVWSKGSFAHLAELIKAGKKYIYCPQPRGTEAFYTSQTLPGRELMHILHEDGHPVNKSEEADSISFTRHPEVVLWPIKGGWVARMFAREPLVCPGKIKFNHHNLPMDKPSIEELAVIESSEKCCGVSLAPRDKEWDHYRDSTMRLHPDRVGEFAKGHESALTLEVAKLTSILQYGDIDPVEAEEVIGSSYSFMEDALKHFIRPQRVIRFPHRQFN
jgi:hypothetical protein